MQLLTSSPIGEVKALPTSEAQCRELVCVPDDALPNVWKLFADGTMGKGNRKQTRNFSGLTYDDFGVSDMHGGLIRTVARTMGQAELLEWVRVRSGRQNTPEIIRGYLIPTSAYPTSTVI